MNIGYLCMDPNASLARPSYAPTIHMTETIRALENLGHSVPPLLYGDELGRSETALRDRTKSSRPSPSLVRWGRRLARLNYQGFILHRILHRMSDDPH